MIFLNWFDRRFPAFAVGGVTRAEPHPPRGGLRLGWAIRLGRVGGLQYIRTRVHALHARIHAHTHAQLYSSVERSEPSVTL